MWFMRQEPWLTGHKWMPAASNIYRHIQRIHFPTPEGSHVCFVGRTKWFIKEYESPMKQETSPCGRGHGAVIRLNFYGIAYNTYPIKNGPRKTCH